MSVLKPGTLCVIVGGCPGNIGLIVEVLAHLGHHRSRSDAYHIRTATGRPFPEVRVSGSPERFLRNAMVDCITDRHKLRPLVEPKVKEGTRSRKQDIERELVTTE